MSLDAVGADPGHVKRGCLGKTPSLLLPPNAYMVQVSFLSHSFACVYLSHSAPPTLFPSSSTQIIVMARSAWRKVLVACVITVFLAGAICFTSPLARQPVPLDAPAGRGKAAKYGVGLSFTPGYR